MQNGSGIQDEVCLDRHLSLENAEAVVQGKTRLLLSDEAEAWCKSAFARLGQVIAENRHVYGVTTGFGPLANRLVHPKHAVALQQNLVNHLASGVGPALSWEQARAVVLARIMSLVQGASGARVETIKTLIALVNSDIAPVIPSRGTVGASGDLTPLAHLVLCLQGRGGFVLRNGEKLDGFAGLERLGVAPLDLSHRDGLALVNGTSAMTGLAVLNTRDAERAIHWALAVTAGMAECVGGRTEAWHPAFSELRPHAGQLRAAQILRERTKSSSEILGELTAARRLDATLDTKTEAVAGQDPYTLRCAPQVIGAVWDTSDWHRKVVETEFCSVTDNPIFPAGLDVPALHGGNFMGAHVALASDALSNAMTVLAGLAERQIARITDETLNRGLPAFLSGGAVGLNSGLMGAQVTATALLAEMRSIGPASVHSMSTNGANQDVVSQGTIAARLLYERLGMLFGIIAIAGLAVAQAMDLRETEREDAGFSSTARAVRREIRRISAAIDQDRPLGAEIEELSRHIRVTMPP